MSNTNNKLVALVFDDPYKADEARAALNRMGGEGLLEIDETALIVKHRDDKVRISQDTNVVKKDQHIGHIAALVTDITKRIGWQVTLSDRYLSNPPGGFKQNDLLLTTGLKVKLGTPK